MSGSLAKLVSIGLVEDEDVERFAKKLGHHFDVTSETFATISNMVGWSNIWDYLRDWTDDFIGNDRDIQAIARQLHISFCERCYDRWDIIDEIWDRLHSASSTLRAEILAPLFDKVLEQRKVPDATIGGMGRPVAIEEVINLETIDVSQFAEMFGNACTLNEENFSKYYRRYLCSKQRLASLMLAEIEEDSVLWNDLMRHLKVEATEKKYNGFTEIQDPRALALSKLCNMSQPRLIRAAIEIITKKLDKIMKKQMEKEAKAIQRQLKG